MRNRSRLFVSFISGLAVAVAPAQVFTRVVDSNTPVPHANGNFDSFEAVSLDGLQIAFIAHGGGQDGIYSHDGQTLTRIVDRTILIPNHEVNFAFFEDPIVDDGQVIFGGVGAGQLRGIFRSDMGSVSTVIENNMPAIRRFSGFDAENDRVVFRGQGQIGPDAIYQIDDAGLALIVGQSTPVPDANEPFGGFAPNPVMSGDNIAFRAVTSIGEGIYANIDGSLIRVADVATAAPDSGELFAFFDAPAIQADEVLFLGGDVVGHFGVYGSSGGRLGVVANTDTPIPDGQGNFIGFQAPIAFDASGAAFVGFGDNGQNGIYATVSGGGLSRVIAAGDVLDGQTVTEVAIGARALDGQRLAFTARFDDGSAAVYVAELASPPPSCRSDLDGDMVIDITDLSLLLSNYGQTGKIPGDIDLDGDVDITDLSLMLSDYGRTCR